MCQNINNANIDEVILIRAGSIGDVILWREDLRIEGLGDGNPGSRFKPYSANYQ